MNNRYFIKPTTNPLLLGRGFNIAVGLILTGVGILNFSTKAFEIYMIILNIVLMFLGLYYLASGIFLFAPNSKYVPHVEIDNDGILIKDDIFHRSRYLKWEELKSIDLGIHQITVQAKSGISQSFKLNEREDMINEQIKSAIIDIGKNKDIIITAF